MIVGYPFQTPDRFMYNKPHKCDMFDCLTHSWGSQINGFLAYAVGDYRSTGNYYILNSENKF